MAVPSNLNVPGMSGVVIFCSIQPCNRRSEGVIEVERAGETTPYDVCARHAEYIMAYFNSEEVEDPDILSREIVFVDDVGRDKMIDLIIKYGRPLEIIED